MQTPDAGGATLQEQLDEQKDEFLRLAADFDNFRKRSRRDAEQQATTEKDAFIRELLPVLDNLTRALAAGESNSSKPLRSGVELTQQMLDQLLRRNGIDAVDDLGRPFDPHRHEAISSRHDPSKPDHVVLEVVQQGYSRGDQLFRPAKVIVNDVDLEARGS